MSSTWIKQGPASALAPWPRCSRKCRRPLHGLAVTFEFTEFNWTDTTVLRQVLDQIAAGNAAKSCPLARLQHAGRAGVVVGSTGGLFEFASDEEIVANLKVIRDGTPTTA